MRQAHLNASAIGGDKRLHCGCEQGASKLLLAALPPLHQHHTQLEYTVRLSVLHPSAEVTPIQASTPQLGNACLVAPNGLSLPAIRQDANVATHTNLQHVKIGPTR